MAAVSDVAEIHSSAFIELGALMAYVLSGLRTAEAILSGRQTVTHSSGIQQVDLLFISQLPVTSSEV